MKLKELDNWYKENEVSLDDFIRQRSIQWGSLSYDKKLTIYSEYLAQVEKEKELQALEARNYNKLPEVIEYFKHNQLFHESGDYRPIEEKLKCPLDKSPYHPMHCMHPYDSYLNQQIWKCYKRLFKQRRQLSIEQYFTTEQKYLPNLSGVKHARIQGNSRKIRKLQNLIDKAERLSNAALRIFCSKYYKNLPVGSRG